MNVFAKLFFLILLPHWITAGSNKATSSSESKESKESVEKTLKKRFPKVNDTQWFKQNRDHFFMSEDVSRWKQRYFVNDAEYKKGKGPVFLIIGSNAGINYKDIESGPWYEYAKKADALLVYVEHRYFGESRPYKSLKVNDKTNKLALLSNEQTLADLGYFVYHFQELYSPIIPAKTKWITFGRGVGGSLAVRMRLKFPQLVHAAVASGAPLLETETYGYFQFIENELSNYQNVKKSINYAYNEIANLHDGTLTSLKLKHVFKLCDHLPPTVDSLYMLYWMISHILAQVVIFRDSEFEKSILNMLDGEPTNPNNLYSLGAAIVEYMAHYDGNMSCLQADYRKIVELYQSSKWQPKEQLSHILQIGFGNRQNLYHRCTENGRFETSDNRQMLFKHAMDKKFYIQFCKDVFGARLYTDILSKGVRRNNINYGGKHMMVSRVIFVNANRDPTSILSITETDKKKQIIAFNMKDAVAGEDLTASKKRSVKEVHDKIPHILKDWLKLE